MEDDFYENLLVELECPICTVYMSPPIRQCATGHSVCESCMKKLTKCALCQGAFTVSRNIPLEALAVKMQYPCINKSTGCNAKLSYTERAAHEVRCNFKGFKCPMEKCNWIGKFEEIMSHWESKPMKSRPYGKSNICHTKLKSETFYVNMVTAHDSIFWFKTKVISNRIYWSVQFVGQPAGAENYYYEIEIFKPGLTKYKILLSSYCQSIELENCQLFKDDGCLFITTDCLKNFITTDQLIYYLRVLKLKNKEDNGGDGDVASGTQKNDNSNNNPLQKHKRDHRQHKPRDHSKGPKPNRHSQKSNNQHNYNKNNHKKKENNDFVFVNLL